MTDPTKTNPAFTNCFACTHSGMEPDDPRLICFHPDSGAMGLYLRDSKPVTHCCGGSKFEQHPQRRPDGSLR